MGTGRNRGCDQDGEKEVDCGGRVSTVASGAAVAAGGPLHGSTAQETRRARAAGARTLRWLAGRAGGARACTEGHVREGAGRCGW